VDIPPMLVGQLRDIVQSAGAAWLLGA